MNNCFDDIISLRTAHEEFGIPAGTLKLACHRWQETKGKRGLESKKLEGGPRDRWITTRAAVQVFKDTQWNFFRREPDRE